MSETGSLVPFALRVRSSERKPVAWLAAAGQAPGGARPCERSHPSKPQRQRHSADAAAGQFVDPWRGC